MTDRDLGDRITAQFSGRGDRADIWRGFEYFLDTDRFLNLGYSRWYQPHFVGSSQGRLASVVGDRVTAALEGQSHGRRLLDVGCGRGGPAIHLATEFGFDVTGVDLVPYNVARARENASNQLHDGDSQSAHAGAASPAFVVGDATALPITPGTMAACTSIDALVYVPERARAIAELAEALAPDGTLVVTDLVRQPGLSAHARDTVAAFADTWDMPSLGTATEYRDRLTDADLDVNAVETLTPHSVGRFRRWSAVFLGLYATPLGGVVDRLLERADLDPESIHEQIRHAHAALPHLEHVLFAARK